MQNGPPASRQKRPKPSSPTRVTIAARRPLRAAATATLVALPPSILRKVRTCSSGTPICSGYRSTPIRPIETRSYGPTSVDERREVAAGDEESALDGLQAALERAVLVLDRGDEVVPHGVQR